jgi:hypothetical protein
MLNNKTQYDFSNSNEVIVLSGTWTVPFSRSWGVWDDSTKARKDVSSEGGLLIASTPMVHTHIQSASICFELTSALLDHILLSCQAKLWKTTDGDNYHFTGYYAFLGLDARLGESCYLAVEKSYMAADGSNPNVLKDGQVVTLSVGTVYIISISTVFSEGLQMACIAKLGSLDANGVVTWIAQSSYIDVYGDTDGDPVVGTQCYFAAATDEAAIYFGRLTTIDKTLKDKGFSYTGAEVIDIEDSITGAVGYAFGCYDGGFIYPAPCYSDSDIKTHGLALRYNTRKLFTDINSWESYDLTNKHTKCVGFHGATKFGDYIYYAPLWENFSNGTIGSYATRYHIGDAFNNVNSWEYYDLTNVHTNGKGFVGVVADRNFVYFIPYGKAPGVSAFTWNPNTYYTNGTIVIPTVPNGFRYECLGGGSSGVSEPNWNRLESGTTQDNGVDLWLTQLYLHGTVLKYDPTGDFDAPASWETFDLQTLNLGLRGFHLGCYDGMRYIYFCGFMSEYNTMHGKIVRYDTEGSFASVDSWSYVDLASFNSYAKGFYGAKAEGQFIYFVSQNIIDDECIVARFNAGATNESSFTAEASWSLYDYTLYETNNGGFAGLDSGDGFVYLAGDFDVVTNLMHGKISRIRTDLGVDKTTDLVSKDSNLKGFHGVVKYPGGLIFIPVRKADGDYHGVFGRIPIIHDPANF